MKENGRRRYILINEESIRLLIFFLRRRIFLRRFITE